MLMAFKANPYLYGRDLYHNAQLKKAIPYFIVSLISNDVTIDDKIRACQYLSYCYYNIEDDSHAIAALFKSFEFSSPRPEICCAIGKHFLNSKQYKTAIFWYNVAIHVGVNIHCSEYSNYIPYIHLCVCYEKLRDFVTANSYNEKANVYQPNTNSYFSNKKFFREMLI